jgi:hypothetical protein
MRYFWSITVRHTNKALVDMKEFRQSLNDLHAKSASWREVGLALGKSASYAMRVARGDFNPSQDALSSWRHFTSGKAPQFGLVEVCPDCGDIHTGRCHGKPVVRVQIVSGKPRNRKRYHRPCMDDETYAEYLQWRKNLSDV